MNKYSFVAIIVTIVCFIVLFVIALIALSSGDTPAEDCLRGNNSACVYFEAQEEVEQIERHLEDAKEVLATAKAEYNQDK